MRSQMRAGWCLLAVGLVPLLGSCGGGSDSPTTPATPTPEPCTKTTVIQDSGPVPKATIVYDNFSITESGRLDISMDWTFASSQIGVYVVPVNTCGLAEFNADTCNYLVKSETTTKPRKISVNFSPGNYQWMVANFSEADESVSLQILLSKGTCPALTATPPSAANRRECRPPLGRILHR